MDPGLKLVSGAVGSERHGSEHTTKTLIDISFVTERERKVKGIKSDRRKMGFIIIIMSVSELQTEE